jgi:hypothetical protein
LPQVAVEAGVLAERPVRREEAGETRARPVLGAASGCEAPRELLYKG